MSNNVSYLSDFVLSCFSFSCIMDFVNERWTGWLVMTLVKVLFLSNKLWSRSSNNHSFKPNIPNEDSTDDVELGKYYVTLMTEGSCYTRYIASSENENGTFKMKHLTRVQHSNNWKWKHPPMPDCLDLYPASIVDCNVDDAWDVSNVRNMTFLLLNYLATSS